MKIVWLLALFLVAGCGKQDDCCCSKTPTTPTTTAVVEKRKDVVCGMWVEKIATAIKAEWDNADYYFCAEDCKQAFVSTPMKYLKPTSSRLGVLRYTCNCKEDGRPNCKCDHCSGKREPCDCNN